MTVMNRDRQLKILNYSIKLTFLFAYFYAIPKFGLYKLDKMYLILIWVGVYLLGCFTYNMIEHFVLKIWKNRNIK